MLKIPDLSIGWFVKKKTTSSSDFRKVWGVIEEDLPIGEYNMEMFNGGINSLQLRLL